MASSKVMASTSPTNPDLPRHSPSSSSLAHHHHHLRNFSSAYPSTSLFRQHQHHHQRHQQQQQPQPSLVSSNDQGHGSFGSMNMDEILRNIYSEAPEAFPATETNGGGGTDGGASADGGNNKGVEDVWGELMTGDRGGGAANREPEMTLEDFLTKAGAVGEEDVNVPAVVTAAAATGGFGMETMMNSVQYQPGMHMQNGPPGGFGVETAAAAVPVAAVPSPMGFVNGMVSVGGSSVGGGGHSGGRGKRRAVEDVPLDKATQQKQRRMIKNRESAARSRERKQAYTVELESLVTQLEEENARLLKEEAELNKQRYKQLMENLIPVVETRRPPRTLRRVQSMSW